MAPENCQSVIPCSNPGFLRMFVSRIRDSKNSEHVGVNDFRDERAVPCRFFCLRLPVVHLPSEETPSALQNRVVKIEPPTGTEMSAQTDTILARKNLKSRLR